MAWLCIIGYFSVMIALVGIVGSVAGLMVTVFSGLSYNAWAVVIFIVMSVLLYRGIYDDLEKMVSCLVATFSLVVIGSVLLVQSTPYAISSSQLLSGFRFELPAESAFVALAVMGFGGSNGSRAVHVSLLDTGEGVRKARWEE